MVGGEGGPLSNEEREGDADARLEGLEDGGTLKAAGDRDSLVGS